MANLELITGHGEADHISSFDMRASNRATFGKGKYILTDADNMTATVNTDEKTLTISAGSCMWSGMHIRNESAITVPFVSPATSNPVYYWLHYTRNSNLVESVEIVSTTAMTVNADLIYDELPDDVTEAYTLFCSFSFNPNGNAVSIFKNEFKLVSGMSSFYDETTQRLNATNADITNKVDSYETYLANYESQIPLIAFDGFVNPVLLGSTSGNSSTLESFSLTDSIYNYALAWISITESGSTSEHSFLFSPAQQPTHNISFFGSDSSIDNGIYVNEGSVHIYSDKVLSVHLYGYRLFQTDISGLASGKGFGLSKRSAQTYKINVYGVGKIK